MDRALFYLDNSYHILSVSSVGFVWKTNLPSSTAFHGFGGPQGMMSECWMSDLAQKCGLPSEEEVQIHWYISDQSCLWTCSENCTKFQKIMEHKSSCVIFAKPLAESPVCSVSVLLWHGLSSASLNSLSSLNCLTPVLQLDIQKKPKGTRQLHLIS